MLQHGEAPDSDRAMAQAGPRAAVMLHRAADEALAGLAQTSPMVPDLAEPIAGYVEVAETFEPADARYLTNHRGHLMQVKASRAAVCDGGDDPADDVHRGEADLIERIAALRDGGYTQFTIQFVPGQEAAIEDWARIKAAFQGARGIE